MIDTDPLDPETDFYEAFCYEAQDDVDEVDMINLVAFTWSPHPDKYPSYEPRKQYKSLLKHILLCANKWFRIFCFIPEINKNGNIHIHGWYIIKDNIAYFKHFLPRCRQLGFVLLKHKVDHAWFDYCDKEVSLTIQVVGDDLPVPLTHKNIKEYKDLKGLPRPKLRNTLPKYKLGDINRYFNKK